MAATGLTKSPFNGERQVVGFWGISLLMISPVQHRVGATAQPTSKHVCGARTLIYGGFRKQGIIF